jgi:hypothetical protein
MGRSLPLFVDKKEKQKQKTSKLKGLFNLGKEKTRVEIYSCR